MKEYKKRMLLLLVEKYRRSKKDSGTERIHRWTKIKPTDLYKDYQKNNADLTQISEINETARYYREKGFITFKQNKYSNEIENIYLVDEQVDAAEQYLVEHFAYESKAEKIRQIETLIHQYYGKSPAATEECRKLQNSVDRNVIPRDYKKMEDILKALNFVESNQKTLYLREASMLIYGSSKYFEDNTLDAVCSLLRTYKKQPCQENELMDEILKQYGIYKEKQKICIKGNIVLQKAERSIDLSVFPSGIEFYTDELEDVERITVKSQRLITVENKTSYLRCQETDTAYFYLGGYVSRIQRNFLKKIYEDNPKILYCHFGDIDAGGFFIHENLCRMTGIPFRLYRMSSEELEDAKYRSCCLPLSANDRKRLKSLQKKSEYEETVSYMLEHNVKLEQEIISYQL